MAVPLIAALWFGLRAANRGAAPALRATVNRDCAPWDGPAFTISIPQASGASISVSVWQQPEIKGPVSFAFPDETGRVGNASFFASDGTSSELKGTLSLRGVDGVSPVEGEFDLSTEAGQRFSGSFNAEWTELNAFCG